MSRVIDNAVVDFWKQLECLHGVLYRTRRGRCSRYKHYVIRFVSDLRQVGGFFRVLWLPPSIKLTPRDSWNIAECGFKHHNPNLWCVARLQLGRIGQNRGSVIGISTLFPSAWKKGVSSKIIKLHSKLFCAYI